MTARRTLTLLLLGLFLASCAPDEDAVGADVPDAAADARIAPKPLATLKSGDSQVEVWPDRIDLSHGAERRLSLPVAGLHLGRVGEIDPKSSYDPYYLEPLADTTLEPDGLGWTEGLHFSLREETAAGITLDITQGDERVSSLVLTLGAGGPKIRWTPPSEGPPAVFFRFRLMVDPSEGLYGLGEHFDQVEHRGTLRAMHFEPSDLESAYNEAHVPVPLLIGTRGWGIFVESYRMGVFRVATDADDEVVVTFGLGASGPEGLDIHLFTAEHPLDVTRSYYEVTGYPGPIAPWALGPWIWRDEVTNQTAVEADLKTIRELDLATTGYWIDRPYASAVNSFDFRPSDYEDPTSMMQLAAGLGFEMALWHTPYLAPTEEASQPLYEYAMAQGYYPPLIGPTLAKWGPPIDLSNPEAYSWWQEQLSDYIDLGIRGFKLDYGEEIIGGAFGGRLPWSFADGSDELTKHRTYQLLYHRVYAELLPETGGFLLCRAAAYGDQVHGTIIWPGDIDSNMAYHGEQVTEPETYKAVGGLPAAVVAGSSLGISGFPWFAADTGGYRHSPPDLETYQRWIQQSALSPVMQVGTNTNDLPWEFGEEKVKDEALIALYRRYARLHLRLFPTLWTLGQEARTLGRAIQRPLGFAHPELGVHPDDIYLLGEALLVAPVVRPGLSEREVPLPAGRWVDWWTGEVYEGESATVQAPIDRIPVLLRAGAMIPLLRATIDTISPVADPSLIDSFATEPNPLHMRVAPGPASTATLYDGTVLEHTPLENGLRLSKTAGEVFDEGLVVELFGVGTEPETVIDGQGKTPEWTFDADRAGTVTVILIGPSPMVDILFSTKGDSATSGSP